MGLRKTIYSILLVFLLIIVILLVLDFFHVINLVNFTPNKFQSMMAKPTSTQSLPVLTPASASEKAELVTAINTYMLPAYNVSFVSPDKISPFVEELLTYHTVELSWTNAKDSTNKQVFTAVLYKEKNSQPVLAFVFNTGLALSPYPTIDKDTANTITHAYMNVATPIDWACAQHRDGTTNCTGYVTENNTKKGFTITLKNTVLTLSFCVAPQKSPLYSNVGNCFPQQQ